MSGQKEKSWDDVAKNRRTEQARNSTRVLLSMFTFSAWGITFVYGWFLGSHEGYAELYHTIVTEWTIFNMSMIGMMINLSIMLTIIYILMRIYYRLHPLR
ncbi:MAG: hypothetical protein ACFFF4_09235 [Candidatus Thorarchaeota archaeon]